MRGVAGISAEILSLFDVPAIAHGNLVEIAGGNLDVDVACSGIRSLQPALMMALFLGELFRFRFPRRAVLIVAGIVIAFACNLARVLLLGFVANSQGFPAIDNWHDPAGTVLMTVCFALLWGMAVLLGRGHVLPAETQTSPALGPLPFRLPLVGAIGILLSVVAGEMWFRLGVPTVGTPWTFSAPTSAQPVTVDREVREMLRFDRGGGWRWKVGNTQEWIAYDLIWDAGTARSRMLLNMHRPDICLAAIGLRILEDRGVVWVEANGVRIPFQGYVFESTAGPLHVYYALYRGGEPVLEHESSVRNACLRAVAERRRSIDQRVLQLAVAGFTNAKDADSALSSVLSVTLGRIPGLTLY